MCIEKRDVLRRMISVADRWAREGKQDTWSKKAKASGYRARSAFKLKQIQERFEVIRFGDAVLDVGCHPGGWSQVAVELVGPKGEVIGVDLQPCQHVDGVTFITGDVTDLEVQERILNSLKGEAFNSIISDISPHITGKWDIDQSISLSLVAEVAEFTFPLLSPGGSFVAKLFQGVGIEEFIKLVSKHFTKVKRFSPMSSRNASSEVYLVCKNYVPWKAKEKNLKQRFESIMDQRLGENSISTDVTPTKSTFKVYQKAND